MLLLVAIALVLIGVATLVIGIFSDTLVWVFISIGSTVLAGIVLYVLYRIGRRQVEVEAPAPAFATADTTELAATPAPSGIPPLEPIGEEATVPAADEFAPVAADGDRLGADFPIAEYDDLRVAEILPLLPELDADELRLVRGAEADGKSRATILARIDELAGSAPAAVAVAEVRASTDFPISGYDGLKVAEILPLVRKLGIDDLEMVADYEERNANRQTILNLIDSRLDALEAALAAAPPAAGAVSASPAAPAKKAGGAKKAAKKVTATKAAKAPAAKKAAPAKSTATKAAAQKAGPVKAAKSTGKSTAKTVAAVGGAAKSARKSAAKAGPATKKS